MKHLAFCLALITASCGGGGSAVPPTRLNPTAFCIHVADPQAVSPATLRAAHFNCARTNYVGPSAFIAGIIGSGMKNVLTTPSPTLADVTDPAAYIAKIVAGEKLYPGQSWELVNEPDQGTLNGGVTFGMTPAQYVAMFKVVIPAMRAADPTATIITGGAVGKGGVDPNWVSEISALWPLVDEIGIHPYPPPWLDNPILTLPAILAAVAQMTGKPVFVTEWGLAQQYAPLLPGDLQVPRGGPLSEAQAALDIVTMVHTVNGITPMFVVYEWDNADDPWAVTEGFGIVGTPELNAFTGAVP